ncbi:MAG: HD domain-containing protein [Synergistaceae bacterium]|nr:HD domain-containing protein [Synergistaceae bacterium]
MFTDAEKSRQWFERYANSFDLANPMIQMKYRHSLDVMNIGERLTEALAWPEAETLTGVAACLLHDTGRFSQYRDFGTYYDRASVDHGDRGYEVLKAFFPPEFSDDEGREAVLQAVRCHNKKELPPALPAAVLPFCRLARDADKLDVFALVQRRMNDGTVADLLPRHKVDAPLSDALLDEVEKNWSGSYKNASSLMDFVLIQLTWVLDLNFAPSLSMLEESGVLPRLRARFPGDARVQGVLDGLFARMEAHGSALLQAARPASQCRRADPDGEKTGQRTPHFI